MGTTSVDDQFTVAIKHLEAPSGVLYALSNKQWNKMEENQNGKDVKVEINQEKELNSQGKVGPGLWERPENYQGN